MPSALNASVIGYVEVCDPSCRAKMSSCCCSSSENRKYRPAKPTIEISQQFLVHEKGQPDQRSDHPNSDQLPPSVRRQISVHRDSALAPYHHFCPGAKRRWIFFWLSWSKMWRCLRCSQFPLVLQQIMTTHTKICVEPLPVGLWLAVGRAGFCRGLVYHPNSLYEKQHKRRDSK